MSGGAWLVVLGLGLAAVGWVCHRDRASMPTTGLRLPAEVVQVEQRTLATADTTEVQYAPRIRFQHPDGHQAVFVADVWTHAPQHRAGDRVHVLVDVSTGRVILDSPAHAWGPLLLFVGSGLLLAAIGVARLIGRA